MAAASRFHLIPNQLSEQPQRHGHECLRRAVLSTLVDDSEPADTIIRCRTRFAQLCGQEICSDLVGRPGLDPGTLGLMMAMILTWNNANSCSNPSDLVFSNVAWSSLLSATSRPLRAHNPVESIQALSAPVRHLEGRGFMAAGHPVFAGNSER